ncbi:MAG: hypothetical protein P8Y23_13810 [Candidatus Lokiarchaeota archaeon]
MDEIKNILITEAEEYEKLSKIEVQRQNYEEAISLLFQAKNRYEKAGLMGQVSKIIEKIESLKNSITTVLSRKDLFNEDTIKLEVNHKENLEAKGIELLEKAYATVQNGELDSSIEIYNQAYSIYKNLNHDYECKQILWQVNEIKEHQKWTKFGQVGVKSIPLKDIVSLSQAEKRRKKIQEQLSDSKVKVKESTKKDISANTISENDSQIKKPRLLQQIQEKEKQEQLLKTKKEQIRKEVQDLRIQKIREKQEKLRKIKEQKQAQEELINQANHYLDQGNRCLKFTSLGWNNQVRTLNQELKNIEIYKKEDERKKLLERQKKAQNQQKFEKRVSTILNEKEKYLKKDKMNILSPEIRQKLEKANFTRGKAEKEESIPNFKRALARYEYILELYRGIPQEYLDLFEEIAYVQQKISELKEKM